MFQAGGGHCSLQISELPPPAFLPDCDCSATGTQGNACRKDPRVGRCVCKPNFQGAHCEFCAPGFYGQTCQRECSPCPQCHPLQVALPCPECGLPLPAACQCSSPGVADGLCDPDSGQCTCRIGFEGAACDRCAPGYFHFPLCQRKRCLPEWARGGRVWVRDPCDTPTLQCAAAAPWGPCLRAVMKWAAVRAGPGSRALTVTAAAQITMVTPTARVSRWLRWEETRPLAWGSTSPHCASTACACDPQGALDQFCGAGGLCRCRPGYAGSTCQECSPGFHGFPACIRECSGGREGEGCESPPHAYTLPLTHSLPLLHRRLPTLSLRPSDRAVPLPAPCDGAAV